MNHQVERYLSIRRLLAQRHLSLDGLCFTWKQETRGKRPNGQKVASSDMRNLKYLSASGAAWPTEKVAPSAGRPVGF